MTVEMSIDRGKPLSFIEPKGDCMYLFMDLREQKSRYIFTPENSQQISETGVIMAKGPRVSDEFQVGDRVAIHYYTGTHLQFKECYSVSQFHRIVREHEILAKINQEERDKFYDREDDEHKDSV